MPGLQRGPKKNNAFVASSFSLLKSIILKVCSMPRLKAVIYAQTMFKKEEDSSFLLVVTYIDDSLNDNTDNSLYR